MNLGIVAVVFGVIFISELPDKSMFTALMLGTKYRPLYVWLGAASAFLLHVCIAVTIGQAFNLLPHRFVESLVALLFFIGALLLFFGKHGVEEDPNPSEIAALSGRSHGFWKIFGAAFGLIFLSEWGDITQIATANYTAHYHDPLSVGFGAVAALWTVTTLAVVMGSRIIKWIPAKTLLRITAVILLIFAAFSAYSVIR